MLGKNIVFLLSFVLLSACTVNQGDNKQASSNIEQTTEIKSKEYTFDEKESLLAITSLASRFKNEKDYSLIGSDYIPKGILRDGRLIAETTTPQTTRLIEYNLETRTLSIIRDAEYLVDRVHFIYIGQWDNSIIFEEYDQFNQLAKYYVVELEQRKTHQFYEAKALPPLHRTQFAKYQGKPVLNLYDSEAQHTKLIVFNEMWEDPKVLVQEKSAYPVVFKDELYYVVEDGRGTAIKQYNDSNSDIYRSKDNEIVTGLYSDGNKLIFSTHSDSSHVFEIDVEKSHIQKLFKTAWFENGQFKNGILTWTGDVKSDDVRDRYYIADLNRLEMYDYHANYILLTDHYLLSVVTKKGTGKGEVFQYENSHLVRYEH